MPGKNVRALALYLPQFHPVPENDLWWGKGFTEWTNVTKAAPRFPGHYQPHLPTDLGFYDLRLHETRIEQAELARQYGIYGFCYYHYWFTGKRILEAPVDGVLRAHTPDFPFCLCWANENWTRKWDGREEDVLLKQQHGEKDDRHHIQFLKPYFDDPRYIRVDGKPIFIVYRPSLFPDIKGTAEAWREECRANGTGGIYLAYMQSFGDHADPAEIGFDAAIEFQPDFWSFPPAHNMGSESTSLLGRLQRTKTARSWPSRHDHVFMYEAVVKTMVERPRPPYKLFPGVFPMWDNTSRREQGAIIVHDATPETYERWLSAAIDRFEPYSKDENFIFLNAWNEWAEGNHLEPCRKWGRAYLEATRRALTSVE